MWKRCFVGVCEKNFKYVDCYRCMFLWLNCSLSLTANSLAMCVKWTLATPQLTVQPFGQFLLNLYIRHGIYRVCFLHSRTGQVGKQRIGSRPPDLLNFKLCLSLEPGGMDGGNGGVHRTLTSQAFSLVWQTHHICLLPGMAVYSVYDLFFLSKSIYLLSEEIAIYSWYHLQNTDIF